jgi:hypothetical protein
VGNVINLNKFRKRKVKAKAEKKAGTNRRLHGRTKTERTRDELQKRHLEATVDGARLEREGDGEGDANDEG